MSTFGKMPTSHQTNPWFRHRRAHAHAPHPANQDHVKSGMQYQLLQYLSKPLLHPVHFQDALHLQQVQHTCTCCDTTLPQPPLLHADSVSKSGMQTNSACSIRQEALQSAVINSYHPWALRKPLSAQGGCKGTKGSGLCRCGVDPKP